MASSEKSQTKQLHTCLITAFVVFSCLIVAAWVWGIQYGRMLLPVYQWSVETLTPYFKVQSLQIERENGESIIKIHARTAASRQLGGRSVQNGVPVSSSTLLGHALQHVIILFTAALSWPVGAWRERGILILLAMPGLILIEILDIPVVLAGALEDLVLANYDPGLLSSSLLVRGMDFMNSGGRLMLSLVISALIVVVWKAWISRRERCLCGNAQTSEGSEA